MTAIPQIGVSQKRSTKSGEVLLGEDWVSPESMADSSLRNGRRRRGLVSLNHSPLARKIIIFNLMALVVLVAGVLFLNPFRDSLVLQREQGLVNEAKLTANIFEASLPNATVLTPGDTALVAQRLKDVIIGPGVEVFLFDNNGALLTSAVGAARMDVPTDDHRSTIITGFLNMIWDGISGLLSDNSANKTKVTGEDMARNLFAKAQAGGTAVKTGQGPEGGAQFSVATPILNGSLVLGVVALTSAEGEIDRLVRYEREQILQMFVIALLVSIGLSLVLASTIANPLADLA
ncbi:MAG: sensor N-terminal transmembrane domain-containing protein, partial [Paracoccaceae bacterium]